jgi:hypothetical protein
MSSYEQKDNSGSLFKNNKREKDTHPNATGKAMIGGKMFYVSAWTKTDKNGSPWQSLSFKPVEEAREELGRRDNPQGRRAPLNDQLNDDIPFAPEWR